MLLRVGALSMITGAVFVAMAWLDPLGPLAIILGALCSAVALESKLGINDAPRPLPGTVPAVEPDQRGSGAAA